MNNDDPSAALKSDRQNPKNPAKIKLSFRAPGPALSSSAPNTVTATKPTSATTVEKPKIKLRFKLSSGNLPAASNQLPDGDATWEKPNIIRIPSAPTAGESSRESPLFHTTSAKKYDSETDVDILVGDEPLREDKRDDLKAFGRSQTHAARASSSRSSAPKKRKDVFDSAITVLQTLIKKDSYGLFIEPVNTKLVPDYLTVIKEPMDFSTIQNKISRRFYRNFEEFERDLLLVFSNSKKYNSPDTIYHKSADKLEAFARKTIDRLKKTTELVVQERKVLTEKKDGKKQSKLDKSASSSKQKSTKSQKQTLYEDGSLEPPLDQDLLPFMLPRLRFPFSHATKNLGDLLPESDDISSCLNFASDSYFNYGPFKTLTLKSGTESFPQPSDQSPAAVQFGHLIYGDQIGNAYIDSLKEFSKGFSRDHPVHATIQRRILELTGGAQYLVDSLESALRADGATPQYHRQLVPEVWKSVNVSAEIDRVKRLRSWKEAMKLVEALDPAAQGASQRLQ